MNQITLDEFDTRLAKSAAELLQTVLHAARLRAVDMETVVAIDGTTACRLTVTVDGPQVQLELLADVGGDTMRVYGATFAEAVLQ